MKALPTSVAANAACFLSFSNFSVTVRKHTPYLSISWNTSVTSMGFGKALEDRTRPFYSCGVHSKTKERNL